MIIRCDKDDCDSNEGGFCNKDITLETTWAGSMQDWRLRCETATKKGKPFKYHG